LQILVASPAGQYIPNEIKSAINSYSMASIHESSDTPPEPAAQITSAATGGATPPEDPNQKKAREKLERQQDKEYKVMQKDAKAQLSKLKTEKGRLAGQSRLSTRGSQKAEKNQTRLEEIDTQIQQIQKKLEAHPAHNRVTASQAAVLKGQREGGLRQSDANQQHQAARYQRHRQEFDNLNATWGRYNGIRNVELPSKKAEIRAIERNSSNWTPANRAQHKELVREAEVLEGIMNSVYREIKVLEAALKQLR
jgi:hypothetical protein